MPTLPALPETPPRQAPANDEYARAWAYSALGSAEDPEGGCAAELDAAAGSDLHTWTLPHS